MLRGKGVAAVYTPKDFELARIMADLVGLVERHRAARASRWPRRRRTSRTLSRPELDLDIE